MAQGNVLLVATHLRAEGQSLGETWMLHSAHVPGKLMGREFCLLAQGTPFPEATETATR